VECNCVAVVGNETQRKLLQYRRLEGVFDVFMDFQKFGGAMT
jgi:hypothetical protein